MSAAPLDPQTILAALGITDATSVMPVAGGWDAAIWRVERGGRAYALRVLGPDQHGQARGEATAMGFARQVAPVPAIHVNTTWRGRPVMLLDWLPGESLAAAALVRPELVDALGDSFGRTQARLHAARVPAELHATSRDWIALAGDEERALQAHLRAMSLRDDAPLHLDYHPSNVLVEGTRVSGILDWANAATGDPRADLARTYSILYAIAQAPEEMQPPKGLLRAFRQVWLRGYVEEAGPLHDLAPFIAWAGAYLLRDMAPKLGRPGVWIEPRHLEWIARWTAGWKRRAGVA
jgi:aminoglycoside phosphotransferase (APT) family kinase protein